MDINQRNEKDAKEVLRNPDILERIVQDMDILGYVGERENKILGYLISISRKLNDPLSGIVVSSSGVGKSKLVDTIQQLTPPEDVVFASRLSPQSLYYMPKGHLKNKLLVIEERSGSEFADYAIRTLQSKGRLTLAAPVRNQTVFFEVSGPVSVLETTTSFKLNQENISRCFILHLDESPEQTERVHRYQRMMKTHKVVELKKRIREITQFHHSMQRLIKKHAVIIPYAEKLSFPVNRASSRRDNQKFLTLIETVTLLFQYQRRKITKGGITFIESTPHDYDVAYDIFRKSYRNAVVLTHPKAGILLNKIANIRKDTFSRKDIAHYSGWPAYMVRDNIRYLEDARILKIVKKHRGTETFYRLSNDINLVRPEELGRI